MRYLNDDLNQPSPLYARLWEARRSVFIGFFLGAFLIFVMSIGYAVLLLAMARFGHGETEGSYALTGLMFGIRMWRFDLFILALSIIPAWMRELETVNEASKTLEQVLDIRLRELEKCVFQGLFPQSGHGKERS